MPSANYSIHMYCKILAYGNWVFTIFFAIWTLLDNGIARLYINTTSKILSQTHDQGTRELSDMAISAQKETLGLLLLVAACSLANGALFFWISKKIKLKYGDQ
jgi:hypothetical protein